MFRLQLTLAVSELGTVKLTAVNVTSIGVNPPAVEVTEMCTGKP